MILKPFLFFGLLPEISPQLIGFGLKSFFSPPSVHSINPPSILESLPTPLCNIKRAQHTASVSSMLNIYHFYMYIYIYTHRGFGSAVHCLNDNEPGTHFTAGGQRTLRHRPGDAAFDHKQALNITAQHQCSG